MFIKYHPAHWSPHEIGEVMEVIEDRGDRYLVQSITTTDFHIMSQEAVKKEHAIIVTLSMEKTVRSDLMDIDTDERVSGIIYGPYAGSPYLQENLYIETIDDPDGKYHLILGRDSWLSDDLTELEQRLFGWAMGEGMADDITVIAA